MLSGRRILVTGVVNRASIAYAVAEAAQRAGAEVLLTSFGRAMSLTRRSAKSLGGPEVLELDVNEPAHWTALADEIERRWGGLDGALHAVAYAPPDALGGGFMDTQEASAVAAFRTSAYSMKTMARTLAPLMRDRAGRPGGAIVGLTFDDPAAWPVYDWMGVSKAALGSMLRYLSRDLGPSRVRVNLVAAGPLDTVAARAIPGFDEMASAWRAEAPLGWDPRDARPVADAAVFLLSDLSRALTGEVIHVDGGVQAVGGLSGWTGAWAAEDGSAAGRTEPHLQGAR